MVCGGFTCSKNALTALNILYILVAFLLIGVGAYARLAAVVTSVQIFGALIACGVFLFVISVLGLLGAVKHNQVLLFFYMLVLFLLFLIQFAVAVALLAINEKNQKTLLHEAWYKASDEFKIDCMKNLECCGFEDANLPSSDRMGHPGCSFAKLDCCNKPAGKVAVCCTGSFYNSSTVSVDCPCTKTCWQVAHSKLNSALKVAGTIGLFFSFTEIIGVWLALRFRNLRDPRVDPSAFL